MQLVPYRDRHPYFGGTNEIFRENRLNELEKIIVFLLFQRTYDLLVDRSVKTIKIDGKLTVILRTNEIIFLND